MNFEMRDILKSKQTFRQRLAARSFGEKPRILEELRACSLAIAASRKSLKTSVP
jgi:hypothetical protein